MSELQTNSSELEQEVMIIRAQQEIFQKVI
jgi:hypothetical protein